MIVGRLFHLVARVFAWSLTRHEQAIPPEDRASAVEVFEQLQQAAWRQGGPGRVLACWWREFRSVRALGRVTPARKGSFTMSPLADLKQAFRALRQSPGFTVTVVLTLALGIGANTAIFSVVDATLLKPLPYRDANQLVAVAELPPSGVRNTVSPLSYLAWRDGARSFAGLAARQSVSTTLLGLSSPEEVRAANVSATYFDVLGVAPARGRTFGAADGVPGAPCVTLLSDRVWARLWSRDPALVGSAIRLDRGSCQVVGILPPDSVFDRVPFQMYFPFTFSAATAPRGHFLTVIARLAPGVTVSQANAEMRTLAAAVNESIAYKKDWTAVVDAWRDTIVRPDSKRLVLVLLGAVAMVLLVAMVNVASLGLSRAAARRREVSIRLALGASAGRVFSYFMAESLLLSSLGGLVGVLLGSWCVSAFTTLMPPGTLPTEAMVAMDGRVLLFTTLLVVVVSLGVGSVPAWQSVRATAGEALRREGRGSTASARTRQTQNVLLVAQIALAMVLVTGAAWLGTSFAKLNQVDPGFDSAGVLTFRLSLPASSTVAQVAAQHARIGDELRSLPGVQAVGASTSLPLRGWLFGTTVRVEGIAPIDPARMNAHIQHTAGDYFDALRIPLVEGRVFADTEHTLTSRVAIVNETFVRRFIGDGPAVGRRLRLGISEYLDGDAAVTWEVVGVVRDLKTGSLADAELLTPEVYVPHAAAPHAVMSYVVRAAEGAISDKQVREAVARVDPTLPVAALMSMEAVIGSSMVTQRFRTGLVAGFAIVSLLVAVTGVYAVRAQAVIARRRELGIRLALGATRGQVARLVVGQGVRLVAAGVTLGIVGAWFASGAIEQWLFAVDRGDPGPVALALTALGSAGLIASWLPARFAARVEPIRDAAARVTGPA